MWAFLKLIPIKDIVYGALIVALLIGFGVFVHHERTVGKNEVLAVQHRETAKREQQVAQVEQNASKKIGQLQTQLSLDLAAPPHPNVVVRMCVGSPGTIATVRGDAVPAVQSDAAGGPGAGMGGTDIAPATEAILARDKAVIDTLQGYVRECQRIGACKN